MSTKGQVVIPKSLRDARQWKAGQELIAVNTPEGVLLKPKPPEKVAKVDDVIGRLSRYKGKKPMTLEAMDKAIGAAVLASDARSKRK